MSLTPTWFNLANKVSTRSLHTLITDTQHCLPLNSTTRVLEVFLLKDGRAGGSPRGWWSDRQGGEAFTDNWRKALNSRHVDRAVSLCLNLAVVVPDALLASSSSSFAWRGSSVQTRHS